MCGACDQTANARFDTKPVVSNNDAREVTELALKLLCNGQTVWVKSRDLLTNESIAD